MTKIQELRKSRKMTGVDFCAEARIHPVALSAIENRRQVPGQPTREKICRLLGVSESELFDENGLAAI